MVQRKHTSEVVNVTVVPFFVLLVFSLPKVCCTRCIRIIRLVRAHISKVSDPIFTESEELHPGDSVRLYTRDGDECVEEGCIVEYGKETWGSTGIFLAPRRATRGLTRRWVVRLSNVLVPLASTFYPEEIDAPRTQPTTQVRGRLGENLLWDANRMRKTVGMTPSPAAAAGHGSGHNAGGGAAYSTTGSSGAAVTGLTGSVTRSEPFFAGELAGVEALSKSASSLATSARVGEIRRRETEVERSETERGVGEVKLDDSWTPKTIPLRKPAPMAKVKRKAFLR